MFEENLRKYLPWLAAASLLCIIICLGLTTTKLAESRRENPENRQIAEQAAARLQNIHPEKLDDDALLQTLAAIQEEPVVATVWLIDAQGNVDYASGSTSLSLSEGNVSHQATEETKSVLATLPDDTLNSSQRIAVMAASAIQAEGEHNDIYRHLLREIKSSDGRLIGYLGIAYAVNSSIDDPGTAYKAGLILFVLALGVYWISLPLWVFLDAKRRSEKAAIWTLFVLAGNFIALLAYILVRHPKQN